MNLMILAIAFWTCAVSAGDSVVNSDFEGKSLVSMGTSLNSPLLKLLGRTLQRLEDNVKDDITDKTSFVLGQLNEYNVSSEQRRRELIDTICQLHPCTDWSSWTTCTTTFKGMFGAQNRSRTCGVNASKLCYNTEKEQTEWDTRICEGTKCPTSYASTTNGYCYSLHYDYKNWTGAQAVCKQEGGYLMNVDSQLKKVDLDSILPGYHFWIDGTRELPSGEWQYQYGPQDSTYSNWYSGEPASTGNCKAYTFSGGWYWFGSPCTSSYYFICEIF